MANPLFIGAAIEGAIELFNRLVPDKNAQARFEMQMRSREFEAAVENNAKQIEANTAQAQHASVFVAGPRPAAMWLCIIALGIGLISKVIIPTFIAFLVFFPDVDKTNINEFMRLIGEIDTSIYISMLLSLLGLGAMRSYDKVKSVDTKKVNWFTKK